MKREFVDRKATIILGIIVIILLAGLVGTIVSLDARIAGLQSKINELIVYYKFGEVCGFS